MPTTGDRRRGRRPALDPNDKRRLAARIAKMVLVDRLEQKEILQQLTKSEPSLAHIDASTVSRLYRFALDTGIVRVHIDENAPFKPPRMEHLERELIAAYELQSAIVADASGHEESLESSLADDRLHQALGQLCADYLDTIVRQNEIVALSSGRAVFYACESLFNKHIFDKRNVRGVKVVSMNGNIAAEVWSMESPDARRAMDADISGTWLARAFPDAQLIRLSLPVAVKSKEMIYKWRAKGRAAGFRHRSGRRNRARAMRLPVRRRKTRSSSRRWRWSALVACAQSPGIASSSGCTSRCWATSSRN